MSRIAEAIANYVESEIQLAFAQIDIGPDGYTSSPHHEQRLRDAFYKELVEALETWNA